MYILTNSKRVLHRTTYFLVVPYRFQTQNQHQVLPNHLVFTLFIKNIEYYKSFLGQVGKGIYN